MASMIDYLKCHKAIKRLFVFYPPKLLLRRIYPFCILFSFLFCYSCKQDPQVTETEPPPGPVTFITTVDKLRLRDQPNNKGLEITQLPVQTMVKGTGEQSKNKDQITLRGIPFNEPWYKVSTASGEEGWVYGGGLNLTGQDFGGNSGKFLQARLNGIFEGGLTQKLEDYRADLGSIQTSEDFARIYRRGQGIRDSLVDILQRKVEVVDPINAMDISWIDWSFPGFSHQLVAEGTLYHLFADFKVFSNYAKATKGEEDDQFINLCLTVHSVDSIEYFYPSWFLQTWDYGGHSLLGQGKHLEVLQKMQSLRDNTSFFNDQIDDFKNNIIADITEEWVSYWESKEGIIKELDAILGANFTFFTEEELVKLRLRKIAFENPEQNGITVNQRAG